MKIIFVCSGNTCRSPMAEGYLKSLRLPELSVQSRGFGFSGDAAAENAVEAMSELSLDISAHRSTAISTLDLDADRIICMTASHRDALIAAGVDSTKISVLGGGISDPFGGDISVYRKCRNEIIDAIDKLVFGGFFTEFRIKRADEGDVPSIARLEGECFSSPWSEKAILEGMNAKTVFFVAKTGDEVLGYIGVTVICDEWYITNIAVGAEHRGRGIGSYLIARLLSECSIGGAAFITLEVRVSNENAIRLYEKYGFKLEGRRKGFYTSPTEDALIMTKRF